MRTQEFASRFYDFDDAERARRAKAVWLRMTEPVPSRGALGSPSCRAPARRGADTSARTPEDLMADTVTDTFTLPGSLLGATPFAHFVITGFRRTSEAVAELLGVAGGTEVTVSFDEKKGTLLIAEGESVRPPRFNELRDLRRVLDAWVRAASRVPELVERVRVGVNELLAGPAKLEQFSLTAVERLDGFVELRGTVGKRGQATVTFDTANGGLSIRYEAYAGAPSRVRAMKFSELAGLSQALGGTESLALEDVREAVQFEFEIVSGERPDPTLGEE